MLVGELPRNTSSEFLLGPDEHARRRAYTGFPKPGGTFLGVLIIRHNDYSILGSIWGSLILGNYHIPKS